MRATVTNFGDNLGIQFPKSLLKNMQISENDDVEILVKDNSIIIKRHETPKRLTTLLNSLLVEVIDAGE